MEIITLEVALSLLEDFVKGMNSNNYIFMGLALDTGMHYKAKVERFTTENQLW